MERSSPRRRQNLSLSQNPSLKTIVAHARVHALALQSKHSFQMTTAARALAHAHAHLISHLEISLREGTEFELHIALRADNNIFLKNKLTHKNHESSS